MSPKLAPNESPKLTPNDRVLRSRLGAHALHAKYDSRELTQKARANSPGQLRYYYDKVDPDSVLDPAERDRRAEHAKSAHFLRLAMASAKARRKSPATSQEHAGRGGAA